MFSFTNLHKLLYCTPRSSRHPVVGDIALAEGEGSMASVVFYIYDTVRVDNSMSKDDKIVSV